MIHVLSARSSKRAEDAAVAELGVSLADLMERAGLLLAGEVSRRVPYGPVAVLAGKGNNGGDGWVAARALHAEGREVTVATPAAPDTLDGIAGEAARRALADGVPIEVVEGAMRSRMLIGFGCVIDAMFGTGFSGSLSEPYRSWARVANGSGAVIVAADVPSGVDADTGHADPEAIRAHVTVTFSAPKRGLLLYPGAGHAGDVLVADIGIPPRLLGGEGDVELWEPADYAEALPVHAPDVHKNSRGRVLVVGGSAAFPGAAVLAAMGAQRMGAGYVTLAVPASLATLVQAKLTSAVVYPLAEKPVGSLSGDALEQIKLIAPDYHAVVLGPGIGAEEGSGALVRGLAALEIPLVVDADALRAFEGDPAALRDRGSPTVVTPHPGELARLTGSTPAEVQADRLSYGARLVGENCVCILKGANTVISAAGRQLINVSGSAALAKAGTGDVLAGMIGSLLAQGLTAVDAGALAVYLHGRAGDRAADELTEHCVIAEDVPDHLPGAVAELLGYREMAGTLKVRPADEDDRAPRDSAVE